MNYKPIKPSEDSFSDHKASYIDAVLESAKKISQSEELKQWTGQTIEKANSLFNNLDWVAKTDKYVKDKLNQADEIMHIQTFHDSIADVMQKANMILGNCYNHSRLGNQVKQLDAIFNKFNPPELPCCDLSKYLNSIDYRVCSTSEEL